MARLRAHTIHTHVLFDQELMLSFDTIVGEGRTCTGSGAVGLSLGEGGWVAIGSRGALGLVGGSWAQFKSDGGIIVDLFLSGLDLQLVVQFKGYFK